jgi:GntR family transcriptional regulator
MSAQPMYHRIADELRKQIESGVLRIDAEGTFVTMNVDPFVTTLTADPATGLGGGEGATYLTEVSKRHRQSQTSSPTVVILTPSRLLTRLLELPPSAQVVSRYQERLIDHIPWSLQTSYYPMDFVSKGAKRLLSAEDITDGTVRYLADTIGVIQAGYRDWITARAPNDHEQRFFGSAHDSLVFVIFRIAYDERRTPMRLTVTTFPADRNQFIVNVGDNLPEPSDEDPSQPGWPAIPGNDLELGKA